MTTFVFLKTMLLLLAIFRSSLECKPDSGKSDEDDDNGDGTSVDPTPKPVERYNCTQGESDGNTTRLTVSNFSDTNDVLCETMLTIPEPLSRSSDTNGEIRLCNYLGDKVCDNCTEDPSYKKTLQNNIEISCLQEQTTTPPPPPSTTASDEETTVTKSTSEEQVSIFSEGSGPGSGQLSTNEILIYAGVGLVVLLVIIIITVVCVRKRRQSNSELKDSKYSNGSEEVLRVEANETGELYTVVNKQGPEKVVYNTVASDVEILETDNNGDLYSVVNKNGTQNGGQEDGTGVYNVLYKENGVKSGTQNGGRGNGLYDTLNRGDKVGQDTGEGPVGESTYNSLHPLNSSENEVYSVANPRI